ncbi:MAG: hypothetical protein AAF518_24620, partial [Spirochaetota bacterium]
YLYIIFSLCSLCSISCTNTYFGIDGPDVIPRKQAVAKLNNALLAKVAVCGSTSASLTLLYSNFSSNPRKVLDGAYYLTKDIDSCVNQIYFGSCESALLPCNVSPKGFFGGGGLFQGGF